MTIPSLAAKPMDGLTQNQTCYYSNEVPERSGANILTTRWHLRATSPGETENTLRKKNFFRKKLYFVENFNTLFDVPREGTIFC